MKNLCVFVTSCVIAVSAFASPIMGTNGFGTPVVPGATSTIDFDSQPNSTFSSLSLGGVTFSGIGGDLRSDNSFPNSYNGRGARYLDNVGGGTNGFRFDFSAPGSGFAFNWGASDEQWTLTAFDSLNNAIESFQVPVTNASNAGDYIGLAATGANYRYATLTTMTSDWVFIDNFTFAEARTAVPEPGSLALLGLGLLAFIPARRKSKSLIHINELVMISPEEKY